MEPTQILGQAINMVVYNRGGPNDNDDHHHDADDHHHADANHDSDTGIFRRLVRLCRSLPIRIQTLCVCLEDDDPFRKVEETFAAMMARILDARLVLMKGT